MTSLSLPIYSKKTKIKGFHGTLSENVDSILKNNFYESEKEIWFGKGVYFFIDGISSESLDYWAKHHTFDNCKDKHKPKTSFEISVLTAEISVNEDLLLDFTNDKLKKMFNGFRRDAIAAAEESGKYIKSQLTDSKLLAAFKNLMEFEFVKSNVYIRLGILRRAEIGSKIDNVTIFVVNNPSKHIQKPSIKEVFKGEIS